MFLSTVFLKWKLNTLAYNSLQKYSVLEYFGEAMIKNSLHFRFCFIIKDIKNVKTLRACKNSRERDWESTSPLQYNTRFGLHRWWSAWEMCYRPIRIRWQNGANQVRESFEFALIGWNADFLPLIGQTRQAYRHVIVTEINKKHKLW